MKSILKDGKNMPQKLAFDCWLECMEREEAGVLATILQTDTASSSNEAVRMFISIDGFCVGDLQDVAITRHVMKLSDDKFKQKKPVSETVKFVPSVGKEIQVFIDVFVPPIEVVIFGAGHDAIPMARCSVSLGLKTIIVDSRIHYNNEERFPGTIRITANDYVAQQQIMLGNRSYIIIMNHHFEKDQYSLEFALNSTASYVGLLGPRKRRVRLLDDMEIQGIVFADSQMEKLYSPIGLDIGADSPEEIAISVLAEVIAIRNGHTGGFLQGSDVIHQVSV